MNTPRPRAYANAALTVIAVLLGANLLARPAATHADAEPPYSGMANDLEQRQVMIGQLREIEARMGRLEMVLTKGLNVRVTEMPPVRLAEQQEKAERPVERPAAPAARPDGN